MATEKKTLEEKILAFFFNISFYLIPVISILGICFGKTEFLMKAFAIDIVIFGFTFFCGVALGFAKKN